MGLALCWHYQGNARDTDTIKKRSSQRKQTPLSTNTATKRQTPPLSSSSHLKLSLREKWLVAQKLPFPSSSYAATDRISCVSHQSTAAKNVLNTATLSRPIALWTLKRKNGESEYQQAATGRTGHGHQWQGRPFSPSIAPLGAFDKKARQPRRKQLLAPSLRRCQPNNDRSSCLGMIGKMRPIFWRILRAAADPPDHAIAASLCAAAVTVAMKVARALNLDSERQLRHLFLWHHEPQRKTHI